jgi:NADPH:quinone reductase
VRAVVCHGLGDVGALGVEEVSDPEPAPGQVLVRVLAAGVNYVDGLIVQGGYQIRPEVPYVPGGELVGVVERLGPGVDAPTPGRRVIALSGFGAWAERVAIAASSAVAVPEDLDIAVAATLTQAYCTAHFALCQRADVRPGQRVLVLGGGGGVGMAAINLAAALGASVVATGSSPEKRAAAGLAGAESTIDPGEEPIKERVRELTGGEGVDIVFDPVGGDLAEPALRTLREGGRYLVIGFASGHIPRLPLNQVLLRNRSVVGVDWGAWAFTHPAEQRRLLEELVAMVTARSLRPPVPARQPLERAPAVLRAFLDRKMVGRVALVP